MAEEVVQVEWSEGGLRQRPEQKEAQGPEGGRCREGLVAW